MSETTESPIIISDEEDNLQNTIQNLLEAYQNAAQNAKEAWQHCVQANKIIDQLKSLNCALREENEELTTQVVRLGTALREHERIEEMDDTWTAKDDRIRRSEPAWWYLKPFNKIIENISFKYPGLLPAVNAAVRITNSHLSSIGGIKVTPMPSEEELLREFKEKFNLEEKLPPITTRETSSQTYPQPLTTCNATSQTEPSLLTSDISTQTDPTNSLQDPSLNVNDFPIASTSTSPDILSPPIRANPLARKITKSHEVDDDSFYSKDSQKKYDSESSSPDHEIIWNKPSYHPSPEYEDYSRYDYYFPKNPVPSHLESSIPSLLNIEVEPPSELDPSLIAWLRRPARRGCWNCGSRTHRFENCYRPRVVFCEVCGQQDTTTENCDNCKTNQQILTRRK